MSVEDEAPNVQKVIKNNATREGKSNEFRAEQKNDTGQKRGSDEKDNKAYKKTRLYKLSELTLLNETPERIYSAAKDSGIFPRMKPQKITEQQ